MGSWDGIKTILGQAGSGRTIEHAPRRHIFFEEGKRGTAVFYILTGVVALTVNSAGKEKIVSLLGPGSFAGKECLATDLPPSMASARALTDCTVLRIQRKEMLRLVKNEKLFARLFLDYLLSRITRYQQVIMDHLCDSSEQRLGRTLLSLVNFADHDEADAIIPHISQQDLAEVVGTTRSRVSFFMNRFRNRGFIIYDGSAAPIVIRSAQLSTWLTDQPHQWDSSLQAQRPK